MFHDLTSFNVTYIHSITSALENIAHTMMSWARELSGESAPKQMHSKRSMIDECNNTNTSSIKDSK